MSHSRRYKFARVLLVASLAALPLACEVSGFIGGDLVTIRYEHYWSFGAGWDDGNKIDSGEGKFFALFYILCVSNQDTNAQNFTFDPAKLDTGDSTETLNNQLNNTFGIPNPVSVPAGQQKTNLGFVIFLMNGGESGGAITPPESLLYASSGQESVVMVRDSWLQVAGPTASDLASYQDFPPPYEPGDDLCEVEPLSSPHGAAPVGLPSFVIWP